MSFFDPDEDGKSLDHWYVWVLVICASFLVMFLIEGLK